MTIPDPSHNGLEGRITAKDYEEAMETTLKIRKENIAITRENYQIVLDLKKQYNEDKMLHELQYFITKEGKMDYKIKEEK